MRASTAHWIITLLSSHLRRKCKTPFSPNLAHHASNTCIFRSCFSLIASQPLICHSPDQYKIKHHNELWRNIFSHPNLQLSEPRARSGALICLQSNRERKAARRSGTWWLPALTNGCQPVIKKERGTCKNFRSLRAQSWEV